MKKNANRRDFIKQAGLGAVASLAGLPLILSSRANANSGSKPNIIFILADDLGYGDLGCYGQKTIQTPSIDRMAQEGMRFTDCYAGSTVCAPSRCCLMTGYHTGRARIRGNKRHPLLPQDVTVAEVLKDAGYATGIIGKWGLGAPNDSGIPNRQGFDYWFGYLDQARAHNYYPDYVWKNEERFFFEKWTYSHDAFAAEAHDFVKRNRANPFFLYLAYTIPHAFNEGGVNGMPIPSDAPYSKENWPQASKNHAAMITRLDGDVGKLFTLLKELGLDENTIVFFSSDNGPHKEGGADPNFFDSNGPLRGIKRDLYEGGIRVPMIARWPGKIQAGAASAEPWAFWDFLPTAAELGGANVPTAIDGLSMVPALTSQPQRRHNYLYWEFYERGFDQAVRMKNWKGVRHGIDAPVELYNLSGDLGEERDIAAQHPDIAAEIAAIMNNAHVDSELYPIPKK
ncbi:MAG: arylsulfatase [Candidatus Omnitrophota bacterium]